MGRIGQVLQRASRAARLAALPVAAAFSTAAHAETQRIFVVPPLAWDHGLSRDQPAQTIGPSDLAALTGGIVFGLSPSQVNAHLPAPASGIDWAGLPSANEYPGDVRYFWVRLDAMHTPHGALPGCAGADSYVVFLFQRGTLFRISWRLLPDANCPSPAVAAREIYARYLAIDGTSAQTSHYRPNRAEAVDISDPDAGFLIPYRWENRGRR